MSAPNTPIQEELQLQLVDSRESRVKAERGHVSDVLRLDSFGRMDPIKQGRHLLSEIEESLKGGVVQQPGISSIQGLFESGERVQTDFEELVLSIASDTNGAVFLPGLKKKERIKEKVDHNYNGDFSRIIDVVRGSVVFDSLEDLYSAVEEIHGKAKIVRIEDRFAHPLSSGYRDLKLNIELNDGYGGSHVAELQFHLQGMLDAKEWETPLYNERRGLEGKLKKMRANESNPLEIKRLEEQVARLQYDAQSVYSKVWQKYTKGTTWQ